LHLTALFKVLLALSSHDYRLPLSSQMIASALAYLFVALAHDSDPYRHKQDAKAQRERENMGGEAAVPRGQKAEAAAAQITISIYTY
jgi:hypothetical protein